ncbi:MAG TPA: hypothetical protein VMM78_01880 [Thermomicrobiales bacterium]|nr:hypothetical protein [Thermomicrobiales bacterium]
MLHGVFLRSQDVSAYKQVARSLANGEIDASGITAQDQAMLEYARKLTQTPAAMTDSDTVALRDAGFNDEQVWEVTFTISVFAMFNRMADAFGLQPPEETVRALNRV